MSYKIIYRTVLLVIFYNFCCNNFALSQIEALNDSVLIKTETIEVDALKGFARFTPITFENISREEVEKKYWMQDLPVFLNGNTSVNSYSESGASVGYSYLSLRGFDQKRISISVNGIPQNDPEDHQVYWVDISDLTASVEDIQLQRGIGTALYGSSSIGGAVNVKTINFFNRKFLTLSGAAGDFNSKRYSVEYSSGLLKNGYGFYGKFTSLKSDGYRDLSWSDHWGYFLSAGKIIGKNSMLKFNLYGSPIKNHLAYLGVNKEYLDGKISGNKLVDRKYNYLTYADETDNYFQPHYELLYDQQISKNVFISNSLSYTRGEGYFNTFFPVYYGYEFDYFRLNSFFVSDSTTYDPQYYRRNPDGTFYFEKGKGFEIVRSDIVTKLTVNNNTYGWFPKIKITHNNGKGILVTGGEIRYHKSEHSGEVTFGSALPPGTQPIHQFYFYNGGKRTYSFFANEIYSVSGKLNAMLGIQYVYHRYNLTNDKFKPYDFNVDYNFLTPRAGLNYNFNDRINMYANFSIAKREPRLKDIYNGEDPNSKPNFRILDPSKGIYEDPLLQPEVMHDYEAGVGYNKNNFNAELNFYYMNFNNEIVNNGQLDNVGQSIVGNAAKSVHRGLELEIKFKPANNNYLKDFSISGNLNLSENYFEDYKEISGLDSSGNIIYGNDYSGNKIILNPELIGNFSLNYFPDYGLNAYVAIQYIGKQYLDNSQNERKNPVRKNVPGYIDKIINPYTVVNAGLSLNLVSILNKKKPVGIFQSAEINFKANNIFNILYETTGNISDGIPYWIPAATRNFYGELKIGF